MNSDNFYTTAISMLIEESSYKDISINEFEILKLKNIDIESLTFMELIIDLEEKFGLEVTDAMFDKDPTVKEFLLNLQRKIK
mgnify:CR=1 FL=1|tara:strand:+ start:180 stop:425 length:246 start_codon:yes stop_codon:yes gene_type:complete